MCSVVLVTNNELNSVFWSLKNTKLLLGYHCSVKFKQISEQLNCHQLSVSTHVGTAGLMYR